MEDSTGPAGTVWRDERARPRMAPEASGPTAAADVRPARAGWQRRARQADVHLLLEAGDGHLRSVRREAARRSQVDVPRAQDGPRRDGDGGRGRREDPDGGL